MTTAASLEWVAKLGVKLTHDALVSWRGGRLDHDFSSDDFGALVFGAREKLRVRGKTLSWNGHPRSLPQCWQEVEPTLRLE